jgi:cyanophycinase
MRRIALHGGGEFLPGDEPFLDALLASVAGRDATDGTIRAVVVPTAAARGRPELAAANGADALERRADALGMPIEVEPALVIDGRSAADGSCAAILAAADLVYLPGGDPDLIPAILRPSTAVGQALREAHARGAVIAGASAGGMALAEWSWTPRGGVAGLGFVRGFVLIPHYDDVRRVAWKEKLDGLAPEGLGYLGLDERTGVITEDGAWRVAGEGAAHWFAPGSSAPVVGHDGDRLELSAGD